MPFLPGLALIFVGAIGGGHPKLHDQLKTIVTDFHGSAKAIPSTSVAVLTAHGTTTKTIVKKLHADGVVGFELVGDRELRAVTYGPDGALRSYLELTLQNGALGRDDMKTLEDSIADDFSVAHGNAAAVAKAAPAKSAPAAQAPDDDEMPATLGKGTPKRAPAAAPPPAHAAAPVETAAVADDASPADAGPTTDAPEVHAATKSSGGSVRAGATLGFGVIARDFATPSGSGIVNYTSSPVGLVSAEGYVAPTASLRVHVLGETTMSMQTGMSGGTSAPTSIARWEASVGYAVTHGKIEISPLVGYGHRSFAIDSTIVVRSPDGNYDYVILGAGAAIPLGGRFTLRSSALFQPCVGGAQSTEMSLGNASRWALDLGASVEMRFTHVFARAGVDYQRFAWSWDPNATAEAGGAVDAYTAGTLALGADY